MHHPNDDHKLPMQEESNPALATQTSYEEFSATPVCQSEAFWLKVQDSLALIAERAFGVYPSADGWK